MKTVNPNAATAILKLVAVVAVVVALLQFCACSPQRKTNKAIQRVLANREALDKVGAEWSKLNPCVNDYKEGQWIELPDSAMVKMPTGGTFPLVLGAPVSPLLTKLFDSLAKLPAPIDSAALTPMPIPNHIEIGTWEQPILKISADKRSIEYDGKVYWWPQRRFVRVDTVHDRRTEDSLKAQLARKDIAMAQLQGRYDEAKQAVQVQSSRGDKWFRWFIVAVVSGIVLLIVSHLIRSRFKLWP